MTKQFKKEKPVILDQIIKTDDPKKVGGKIYTGCVKTTYPDGSFNDQYILADKTVLEKQGNKRQ